MYPKEDTQRMIENKSVVIGNCVEPFWEENTVTNHKELNNTKKVRVLTVAKIRPVKNISKAAEAVDILCGRGYDALLTVVGENQDNNEFNKIKSFDHVEILPFMKKEELIKVYKANDIFLLPSLGETFGRVYVEAMTQGLPVLYTKGEGFDGNFPDGLVGYAVPSDDANAIADRIEQILSNYESISQNCVNSCGLFYEKGIMDQVESFYENALRKGDFS